MLTSLQLESLVNISKCKAEYWTPLMDTTYSKISMKIKYNLARNCN